MAELQPCGTYAAYQRHLRKGEETCDACRQANTVQARTLRTDPAIKSEQNARSAARSRAAWRLTREYPERYRQLANEELAKLTFPEEADV